MAISPIPQSPIANPGVNPGAFADVVGIASDAGRIGVIGSSPDTGAFGFLAGADLQFTQHVGVYGESDRQGVMGLTTDTKGTGVYGGGTSAAGGRQIGVRGETSTGVGVQGQSFGAGLAGNFIGNVEISGVLTVNGTTINTQIDQFKREIEFLRLEVEQLRAAVPNHPPTPQPQPTPPPPSPPTISVSSSGSGQNATFTVIGSGFTPGANVRVRIVDDALNENDKQASADGQGHLNFRFSLPCQSGLNLHFSATDGRPDPNLTGVLFSNNVQLPCP